MSWSWTLHKYLALQFLIGVAVVYGAFLMLAFSMDIVDLINRTAGHSVTTGIVIGMAVLQLPDLGQKLLPFSVLLGGVFAFARLSRNQELVATRAAGLSAWDFLAPPLVVAVLIGVFEVTVFTPISAQLLGQFAALEAKYIRGEESQLAVSINGLFLRQGDVQQQSVIHALRVADQGQQLEDVDVFLYKGTDRFTGRIDAHNAELKPGYWLLHNAFVSGLDGVVKRYDEYRLPTTMTRAQIQESFASPDTLSFWALPGFIRAAQNAGFAATRYELYFYTLLAAPALFAAMVFMAASFSLRLQRGGGLPRMILISALSGFGIYFFADLTRALGQSGILPILLAATAPALASILIGMTLVFHQEDG